jgi:hypothetical protein
VALFVRTRPQLRAELADPAGSSQPAGHRPSSAPHPQPQLLSQPRRLRSTSPSPPQVLPTSAPKVTSHIPFVLAQRKVALVDLPFQAAPARGESRSSFPIYSSPSPCYLIWKWLPESPHS